jgi:hypothetical protein
MQLNGAMNFEAPERCLKFEEIRICTNLLSSERDLAVETAQA